MADFPAILNKFELQFIQDFAKELYSAKSKFPSSRLSLAALTEETGELAKALLDVRFNQAEPKTIYLEAVQVAVMACRVALEGDSSINTDWNIHLVKKYIEEKGKSNDA